MFAQSLAQRLSRAGVHCGCAIVAIVFLMALTTTGCMGVSGALIVPLTKEFGWSTEQISGALALRIVLFGLMAPSAAALIDKYGFRRVVLVVYDWVFASHMMGAAVAAWAGGFSRSTFETYLQAFYAAGVACLIAAAAVWLIGRTQSARERLVEARA